MYIVSQFIDLSRLLATIVKSHISILHYPILVELVFSFNSTTQKSKQTKSRSSMNCMNNK